jgi:hypothetical protein
MKKTVLIFGLISGAVSSGMMLATLPFIDKLDFDKGAIIGYTSLVASALVVFFGIRSYRDSVGGGHVGFGKALGVGLLITLISLGRKFVGIEREERFFDLACRRIAEAL